MNIPSIILGVVMICIGIFIVILQIKWLKKGFKDQFGYQLRFLLSGFALILGGIIVIVKSIQVVVGDMSTGLVKSAALVIDAAAGHLIKTSDTREKTKLVLDAVKTVADKVVDKVINGHAPHGHVKTSSDTQTMQQDNTKTPPPPKPIPLTPNAIVQ